MYVHIVVDNNICSLCNSFDIRGPLPMIVVIKCGLIVGVMSLWSVITILVVLWLDS